MSAKVAHVFCVTACRQDLPRQADAAAALVAEVTAAGGKAVFVPCDVGVASQIADGVARLVEALGPPTLLFNHAGTLVVKPFLVRL